ncbi:MAG: hypothetical protein LBT59_08880 [Clostridiales bacterium]|jgi:hypothetical protein|nr:hypothetical protein [Clostridiales bacterium]
MTPPRILKSSVIAPPIFGVVFGALLFILGAADDAPGLCLIGLVFAFLLIMLGAKNTGLIPKGFIQPFILLCFGTGSILLGTAWFRDTEFDNAPIFPIAALCIGAEILSAGILQARRRIRGKQ